MPETRTQTTNDSDITILPDKSEHTDNSQALNDAIEATAANPSLDDFKVQPVRAAASFDVASPAGHHKYWLAMNAKHADFVDIRLRKISVVDWIIFCKEVTRKDGSIDLNGMVTVLFLADGTTASWASPTTNKQWCSVVQTQRDWKSGTPLDVLFKPNPSTDPDKTPWYSILPYTDQLCKLAKEEWAKLQGL